MQGNVICCPYCQGTGEVCVEWWIATRYQDCTDWMGPFGSREEAEKEMDPESQWRGYSMEIVQRVVQE